MSGAIVVRCRRAVGAFTMRDGPVAGVLGGTNLSATVDDDPDAVRAARRWAGDLIGVDGDGFTFGYQTHGSRVATVSDRSAAVGVAPSPLAGTDALVTDRPGLGVGVLVADCVPTMVVGDGAVAVVHSGWRGLLAGVVQEAVAAVSSTGGGTAVAAFVGPAAGVCCYEVSGDLAEHFERRWPDTVAWLFGAERPHVDLRLAVSLALAEAGVVASYPVGPCTLCDRRLWSHRRGDAGRQALVAAVAP